MAKRLTGTKEWAPHSDNCALGCEHDCLYCYARYQAVYRFKRIPVGTWSHSRVDFDRVMKPRKKLKGAVMFPTQHDITPSNLWACLQVIHRHLNVGNQLLIVSKPHLYCIWTITNHFGGMFGDHRKDILFRFTIGALDDDVLKFWEPGAPCYLERRACLELAREKGWDTSVSIEPLLTPSVSAVEKLIHDLQPYVTHSIWIGTLNKASQRVIGCSADVGQRLAPIVAGQTKENMRAIYEALKDHPLVRWKESYKKTLGLKEQECAESEEV